MKIKHLISIAAWLAASMLPLTAAETSTLKYGLYIHFGMPTFANAGEKGRIPAERFAPAGIDFQGWVKAAQDNKMTFAVLTAKHESGFCLWKTAGSDYDVFHSPVKKDLVAEFIAACKTAGVLPGVHYSIPDIHNEGGLKYKGPVGQAYYGVIKQHLTELVSQHRDLRLVILDASSRLSPEQKTGLRQLVKGLNDQCVVLGGEDTSGGLDASADAATIVKNWFWSAGAGLSTADGLFKRYSALKNRNQPFLMNVAPDRSGKIPEDQLAVLKQFTALKDADNQPSPATDSKPSAAERLKQLKSLKEQGLISKEDYDKKVKEIVDGL
jgi:alpha-L-fucosidase